MSNQTMHIQVVTPEKVLLDDEADEVIIPTTSGEITLLPHHIPLVSQIAPGIMIIKKHGREEDMVIQGGFIQVTDSIVRILADYAVAGKDISVTQAEEAKKRAEKAMREKTSEKEVLMAETELQRAILELKAATRKRSH